MSRVLMLRDIRAAFVDFFVKRGHTNVPSSPLVPHDDGSLLYTNSGMVQFKGVFLGKETRPYSSAVTSQKCLRAGGKHNDLENVGYTIRHHTFFEMLGNFSFGDYFKDEAIAMAWEMIIGVLGLAKDKLYVTINHTDDEARNIWKKVSGLTDDRIIPVVGSDNFWSMGDTGPCGPCSEIFYDYGEQYSGVLNANNYDPDERYIEIWNLVFMQNILHHDGSITDLPKKSIDTGMGLERVAAVCQDVRDNYHTDVFKKIITKIKEITNCHGVDHCASTEIAMKVVSDHVRAAVFLISEGVLPGNVGREYALRKIIRRGVRYAYKLDNAKLLLGRLVPYIIEYMGDAYPEIVGSASLITQAINDEDNQFSNVIKTGVDFLNRQLATHNRQLPDELPFKLYDTYGFPFDLTSEILREHGIEADEDVFNKYMEQQKAAGRASWKGGEMVVDVSSCESSNFVGYYDHTAHCKITGIIVDGHPTNTLLAKQKGMVILDTTPFYAVSGGQIGDTGSLIADNKIVAEVLDCIKSGAVHIHDCIAIQDLHIKQELIASIDLQRRQDIACNHSATHLLHHALRKILGPHVNQKGSLVANDRLRFDFSHDKPLDSTEIDAIEREVNDFIRRRCVSETYIMGIDEAKNISAMALFGEKYGEKVRVVKIGDDYDRSIELCGGSHVRNASEIRLFKIISSSSIGSGLRRIEAITGEYAIRILHQAENDIKEMGAILNVKTENVLTTLKRIEEDKKVNNANILLAFAQSSLITVVGDIINQLINYGVNDATAREITGSIAKKIRETIHTRDMIGKLDYLFEDVNGIYVVLLASPRLAGFDHLKNMIDPYHNMVIAIEYISDKFGKIRAVSRDGYNVNVNQLLASIVKVKGNITKKDNVWEAGFIPNGANVEVVMTGILKRISESVI